MPPADGLLTAPRESRSVDVAPSLDFIFAHHDDVSRDHQTAQRSAQPHGLVDHVIDRRLDHQEVEVAVLAGLPSGVGAEQDHPRLRRGGLQQSPAGLGDDRLVKHVLTVARPAGSRTAGYG